MASSYNFHWISQTRSLEHFLHFLNFRRLSSTIRRPLSMFLAISCLTHIKIKHFCLNIFWKVCNMINSLKLLLTMLWWCGIVTSMLSFNIEIMYLMWNWKKKITFLIVPKRFIKNMKREILRRRHRIHIHSNNAAAHPSMMQSRRDAQALKQQPQHHRPGHEGEVCGARDSQQHDRVRRQRSLHLLRFSRVHQ